MDYPCLMLLTCLLTPSMDTKYSSWIFQNKISYIIHSQVTDDFGAEGCSDPAREV